MRDRVPRIKRKLTYINYAAYRFIGITGGRDRNPTKDQLRAFGSIVRSHHLDEDGFWRDGPTHLVQGTAKGIDQAITGLVRLRLPHWLMTPASGQWKSHPIEGGKIRNAIIVRSSDYLICFGGGFGTWNCVKQAIGIRRPVVDLSGLGPREGEVVVPVQAHDNRRPMKDSSYIRGLLLNPRERYGRGKAKPPGRSGGTGNSSR